MIVNEKQIEYAISLVETRGKTYDEIAAGTGISKSTISRLVKQHQATAYTIDMLASYFEVGKEMTTLGGGDERPACPLVAGVSGELKRLEGLYSERESRIIAQSQEKENSIKAQMAMMQQHHEQALAKRDETYDRSVSYLKSQVEEMRKERKELHNELDKAKKRADDLDNKRHNVFWGMLTALILMSVAFVVALFSNSVLR